MSTEALGWYGSIFVWLLLTGIGIPPCPEEAGIIYAAGVTALHGEVKWWLAWPATRPVRAGELWRMAGP